jgi:uncharacterized protein (TIGR03790 family)
VGEDNIRGAVPFLRVSDRERFLSEIKKLVPSRLLKKLFSLSLAHARASVNASESAPAFPNRDCEGVVRSLFQQAAKILLLFAVACSLNAQTAANVLVVVNRNDPTSLRIGEYYRAKRAIPSENLCRIETVTDENISWKVYESEIEQPIAECLKKGGLREKILYIVTTLGMPLKMAEGEGGLRTENAAVDSELTLLYGKMKGSTYPRAGPVRNPYFGERDAPFRHPAFPIYLVTRLSGWNFAEVQGMIDRSLAARNRGKFVIDTKGPADSKGDNWLRTAALLLPADRVILDNTHQMLYGMKDVIAYASWGSNDSARNRRFVGFEWLPGAIVSEFVSTNARSLKQPPENWTLTVPFDGWQQNLATDYLHEGATGAGGNVYEPYLETIARPDYLLPAYYKGRNLAESYYLAMPALSWQNIVLGDPLCSLGKP